MIQQFLNKAIAELGNGKGFQLTGNTYDNFVVESADPENPVVFDRDAVVSKAQELEAEYNSKNINAIVNRNIPLLQSLPMLITGHKKVTIQR